MNEVIKIFIECFQDDKVFLVTVIVPVVLLFNFKKIIDFFDERKKAKVANLKEALKCPHIQGITKSHLEEDLATEYFKFSTGIRLEKIFREKLIQEHIDAKGELSFLHYKRALPHIVYKNSALKVKITLFEWFRFIINLMIGFLLIVCGILLLTTATISKPEETGTLLLFFKKLGISCFFVLIGFFIFTQSRPVISAMKIKKNHNKANATDAKKPQGLLVALGTFIKRFLHGKLV